MAHIHFKNGYFIGLGTWEERNIWKKAGFRWSVIRKSWVTDREDVARAVQGVSWTQAAIDHVEQRLKVLENSVALSYASDTTYEPPVPPGNHPLTGKPFAFFPYQKAGIEYALQRKDTLIADQPGLGKQSRIDTPIYTPTGWRKIGDLKVGDEVYSSDGKPTKVIGVFPQGFKPNYKVTFRDGFSTNCGLEHLWLVGTPENRSRRKRNDHAEYQVRSLRELIESGISKPRPGNRKGARWYIPLTEPIEHPDADLPIDPYIFGVILGDGSTVCKDLRFSASDKSAGVVEEVRKRLPAGVGLYEYRGPNGACPYYRFKGDKVKEWQQIIKSFKLNVTSAFKFIPKQYKLGSVQQRLDLLRGLMDTDGSCSKNRTVFHTTSPYLSTDVCQIVQSLGGLAIRRWYERIGERKPPEVQVNIKLSLCPFYLARKAQQWKPYTEKRRYITEVRRIEDAEQVCIAVANPRHLYLAEHFIVTHNTTMGIGVCNDDPNAHQILVVCPATLKEHWRREFELWKTKGWTVGIAETKYKETSQVGFYKNGKPKFKTITHDKHWPKTDVVVINYDILGRFHDEIHEHGWDVLICDEAHALKTDDSGRTLFVLGGRRRNKVKGKWETEWFTAIEASRRVFLTGTPMMNRPIELWPMIHAFDPGGLGRDRTDYGYRYCGGYWDQSLGPKGNYNFSGSSNEEELGQLLRGSFMIRRLKKEVLPELPDKFRQVVLLDSPEIRDLVAREDELARELRLYEDMLAHPGETPDERAARQGTQIAERAGLMGFRDGDDPDGPPDARFLNLDYAAAVTGLEPPAVAVAFEEIAIVRRELGLAKLSAAVPWIKNFLDGGEKLIVFAYHTEVLQRLKEELETYNPVLIYGAVHPNKRQGLVDTFQNDEACRVALLQTDTAGVGLTMTRAKDVCFLEGDWVPTKLEQAYDRICRIGQKAAKLMGFFLVANGSLDCKMAQRAYEKEEDISAALDT